MARSAFVISDIHLGASMGLLTAITEDSPTEKRALAEWVMDRLIETLKSRMFDEKIEQCVLLGDIFDLSFAPYGLAMQNGRWFFERLAAANLFESFVYVPGNHDHHLWQQINEHYYLMTELDSPPLYYPRTLPPHTTLENTFLDRLLPDGRGFQVTYPNYQIDVHGRRYYMHHGHFLQKLYVAASKFLEETIQTKNIEDLELLNSPFLEFGWYNIGQAYNMGHQKLIDQFYYMVKNNQTRQLDKLLKLLLNKINDWDGRRRRRPWNLPARLTDRLIQWLGPFFIKRLFLKHSRLFGKRQHASSARHQKLEEPLYNTIVNYIDQYLIDPQDIPHEVAFIFGHTHEPAQDHQCMSQTGRCYSLYNTGGWIVDQIDATGELRIPQAAPLLIDQNGEVQVIDPFEGLSVSEVIDRLNQDPSLTRLKATLQGF